MGIQVVLGQGLPQALAQNLPNLSGKELPMEFNLLL